MKVVLTQDVLKLGLAGDIKTVRDGYGRNYLIPQGLAVLATRGAMRQAEEIRKRALRHHEQMATEYTALAARINEVTLTFQAKAGETGRLYGSITPASISARLSEKLGIEIDRRKIDTTPLRDLGQHRVPVHLANEIIGTCTVVILREGEAERKGAQVEAAATPSVEETPAEVEAEAAAEPAEAPAAASAE
jgi:large subunit ribosomal protein L9